MAGDTPVHIYVEGERCLGVRKGAWTKEEDDLLKHCIHKHGEGNWRQVPSRAGLNRCRKSCRMRWLNYLKPDINNGEFKEDEVDLLIRLHKLLGNRWSLIAGRLPGRTSNNVKNYWNTHLRKKVGDDDNKQRKDKDPHKKGIKSNVNVIKPRARTLSKNLLEMISKKPTIVSDGNDIHQSRPQHNLIIDDHETSTDYDPSPAVLKEWWESFKFDTEFNEEIFTQSHSWCHGDQTLPSFSIDHHHHQLVPNIGDIINFGAQDHQTCWGGYYATIDMDLWGLLNADK